MKSFLKKIVIVALSLGLSACTSNTPRKNQVVGATVGAAAGAALGANSGPSPGPVTMVGMGAIVGALIGSSYGNYMESSDKEKAFQAIAAGKPAHWQNTGTRVSFTVTPAPQCITLDGNPHCRKFMATQTTPDGSTRRIFQTACLGAHGTWALAY